MARTNNLTNFLNDVATAIKTKLGDSTPIPASQFDTKIGQIETGGTYQTKSVTISSNGTQTVTPDTGYDALSSVVINVQVPVKQLQSKTYEFTQNTHIVLSPEQGYDGFSSIDLTINVPSSQINNQDKTITQNGSYTADQGYTGLGTVTVNVPSGSGDVKLFDTVAHMQADPEASEGDLAVVYREDVQPVTEESEFDSCIFPNTVVLDSAFSDDIYGVFGDTGSSYFYGTIDMSSSYFNFDGESEGGRINVQYTSSDGITYTRTDGGEELQEFGTTIKWNVAYYPWNDVIGNFMKIGGNYFEGMYEYKSNEYVMTKNQLNATPDYVYETTFYGKNGVESGTLTTGVSNSFTDVNAEVYAKIQVQYNNMQPRILTDQDKDIDSDIRIIPSKTDGTPLLDTSNVTDMYAMFSGCYNLTSIPLLDTRNVTDMYRMFDGCSNLTSIPLLDTRNVTDMYTMFGSCSNLTSIPLLDTSKVTRMEGMFYGCSNLTSIPLLDTSNVTNMRSMFGGCSNLTSIPLLDTRNVTNMYVMFDGCSNLNNESLNNILTMCANAVKITSKKTLKYIGLTSAQATICRTLSNYSAFTSAGWTTGY